MPTPRRPEAPEEASPPPVDGLLETSLYVEDVRRSAEFYERVLGFEVIRSDERLCSLGVAGRDILLLFARGAMAEGTVKPGGRIPPHDGRGTLHVAFRVASGSLDRWERWLREQEVEIESRVSWPRGGESLFFRDLDAHLLEVATRGLWPLY